ncbi:FAD synthetase [Plasmodium yoelii]|uniref:FAD synthase n=2 Tax=Plasmodium yoelii TaxID=5861 RepID=Q7R7Y6_PLAYO|nr:FAD synthetase [Plasmodium yoelii]EAA19887.1 fad synthetase [Plasmodium yoelii yoelii]CDU19332.1 FAD synthetase, putative [Plasmodium yoelii]VTZ79967.1 FAD synthetase, putative [Plasmodium yoelii]|eukprot:XP_728322.1 FAD synthetase [Plasmodium yoelii]
MEEWKDYSKSLELYEKIEKIHKEYINEIKHCQTRTNCEKTENCENCESCENAEKAENCESRSSYGKNRDIIKPSMYNYDVVNYYKDELILKKKILELSEDILTAINNIYDMFRLCKENVFLSFNGGKDAVVILHLFRCAYAKYLYDVKSKIIKPKLIYFKDDTNEFPEIHQFVNECVYIYDFDINIINGKWETSITDFIEYIQKKYRDICINKLNITQTNSSLLSTSIAFINGTRYNDTYSEKLHILNVSSKGLPPYLYLNPIFYWTYGAVWTFILYFKLDYCILYDHGYSSIGSMDDTIKNEFLKCNNCYLPAYFLKNWEYERYNRLLHKKK